MIKRMIAILLAVLMLLSLVGCGEQGLEAPNGAVLKETENYGVPTFGFAGTTIPVGLGLPQLTDEEIDALLEENDPRAMKSVITTLADFVNLCYRGKFSFGDGLIYIYDDNENMIGGTTSSGYQTLERRIGQCASMSSCLHYVLADDYEEIGYVSIDGHAMAYILSGGLYYLINPVEYVYNGGAWASRWLEFLPGTEVTYCSSDFQDIADSIYGKEIGMPITSVYSYISPGDLVLGWGRYPVGTTATCWYGEPITYYLFDTYDWVSQESVVEEECIVMYPPEEPPYFTFAGTHEKNGKKGPINTIEDVPVFTLAENATVVEYLKEIGAITFTNAELTALVETEDLDEISRVITTAEDCTQVIALSGIKEGNNESIDTAFAKKLLWPQKIVEMSCRILEGDYEEVGIVTTLPGNYYYLYVKQDRVYAIFDVLRVTHTGQRESGVTFDSADDLINYAIADRSDASATMKA